MNKRRSPQRVDRHRDRERSRPGPYPRDSYTGRRPGGNRMPPFNRVFVSNIPYEEKWQNIKDLFREKVGEVTYVELVTDDSGRSRGYGIIEFKTKELAEEAVKKMKGHELSNRKLVIKEDFNGETLNKALSRDGRSGPPESHPPPPRMPIPGMPPPMPGRSIDPLSNLPPKLGQDSISALGNYNHQLMQEITGGGPFGSTVFVANLDYKVTYSKLKEVFKLAGNVVKVDLHLDKDNKSRGMATVTYETAMEAVQAISMFHKQLLYDRPMMVKMDKDNARPDSNELPSGLQGIGPSLDLTRLPPINTSMADTSRISGDHQLMRTSSPALPGSMSGINRYDGRSGMPDLNRINASRNMLDLGLNGSMSNFGGVSNMQMSNNNFSGIPGLTKPISHGPTSKLSSMPGMGRRNDAMGVNANLYQMSGAPDMGRNVDSHAHMMSNNRLQGLAMSDRERIEMDIARVDSRIRDLDRSLAEVEDRKQNMNQRRDGRMPNSTVFVRNLPFHVTWQKLKERFSRAGNVQFAEIKMDKGKSKGYGHVRFETAEQAHLSIQYFDGTDLDGRVIDVRLNEEHRRTSL